MTTTPENLTTREIAWRDFPHDAAEILDRRASPSAERRAALQAVGTHRRQPPQVLLRHQAGRDQDFD
jgi:hypothetical protein